ncbi:MAG: hypothetical protein K9M45_00190 [Kiritimatiellales bacterium]|nr:hypothetical protein [Kiritimatiellales bacterium]
MNAKSYTDIASHAVVRLFSVVVLLLASIVSGEANEADLEILSVSCATNSYYRDENISLDVRVINNGPNWCSSWTLYVHASTDSMITSTDPLLETRVRDDESQWIGPGQIDTISLSLDIPESLAEECYFIGARSECTDDPAPLNNTGFDPTPVCFTDPCDLNILEVDSTDGPFHQTEPFQVFVRVENLGPGDTSAYDVRFYASSDPGLGGSSDQLIGQTNRPAILSGEEDAFYATVCVPGPYYSETVTWGGVPSGDYYIIAIVSGPGDHTDDNDTGNDPDPVNFSRLTDLVLEEIMAPDVEVIPGNDLLFGYRFHNNGPLDCLFYRQYFYLSSDTLITDTDIRLSWSEIWTPLSAGSTTSGVNIVTVPSNVPPGDYYLGGYIEYADELVPADNTAYDASPRITVLPRLELEIAQVTTSGLPVAVGGVLELDCEIAHVSGGTCPEYTVSVYFAGNWIIPVPEFGSSCVQGPLGPGQTNLFSLSVPVPASMPVYSPLSLFYVHIDYDRPGNNGHDSISQLLQFCYDDFYEPNDNIGLAYAWPSNCLGGVLSTIDGQGLQYDDDWYSCHVDTAFGGQLVVTCSFVRAEGSLGVSAYDTTGALIAVSAECLEGEHLMVNTPTNGWYYLKVHGPNAGMAYDLSFTNRPPWPFAPTNVVAQTGSAPGTIDLSWDSCAGATGYTIHYDDGYICPPFNPADDGTPASGSDVGGVTNGVITHLSPEQFYHLAVKAYNANGESEFSEMVSARAGAAIATDDAYEKNNSLNTAWYPGSPWPGIPLSDFSGAGIQADDDWYRLVLQPIGYEHLTVTAAFVRVEGDIMLDLYDDQTNLVATSVGTHDMELIDVVCPAPGNYFLKVWGEHAGNSYNLIWNNVWVDSKPIIDVSPGSFDFGRLEAGQSSNTVFTIRNDGGGTLTGNASVSSPLSILSSTAFNLVHSQTQDFLVRFSAGSIGVFTNDLVFSGAYGTACQVTGQSGAPRPHIKNFKILSPKEAVIEWDGVKGAEYYILTNMDLASDSWSIFQYGIPGAVFNSETSKVFSATNMFYRLGVD